MRDSVEGLQRFADLLELRGWFAVTCGVLALAWPDGLLLPGMLLTGVVLLLSGTYEVGFSVRNRRLSRGWPLALIDGGACVAMAFLSATLTVIPFRLTALLAGVWLFGCGALAMLLALATWPMRRTRIALALWGGTQIAFSCVVAWKGDADLVVMLYVGAAYTVGFGIFQVVSARWMRLVALPHYEATRQHGWVAPRLG